MKTAEDFQKLIEGFSGDISADNALQVSAIRNGLELHCNSSSHFLCATISWGVQQMIMLPIFRPVLMLL